MKQLQFIKPLVMLMALTMAVLIPDRVCAQVSPMTADETDYVVLNDGENYVTVQNPTTGSEWSENKWDSENYTVFRYEVKVDCDVEFFIQTDVGHASIFYKSSINTPSVGYFYGSQDSYDHFSNVKVGDVIYIGVRGKDDNVINSCNISVTVKTGCAPGQHSMEYVPEIPATCTDNGTDSYYYCSTCDFYYADEEGTERKVFSFIYPIGHDFDNEGNCQREGCGYKPVELERGDNTIAINSITENIKWYDDLHNPNNYNLLKYTVLADGNLIIKSIGSDYMYGVLYDSNMQPIVENWEYPDMVLNKNDVHTGDVYYIGIRPQWFSNLPNCIINVDAPLPSCAPGEHQLTYFAEKPGTCTSNGNVEYWHCSVCGRDFTDKKCLNQIFNIVAPALGHDFDADGNCSHAGCNEHLNIIDLTIGYNDVNILNPTLFEEWKDDKSALQHYTFFRYVVKHSGDVIISAVGDKDTYGVLYDKSLNYIGYSDDVNNSNFQFVIYDAHEGDVYFIGARGYADNYIGQYIINVDNSVPSCSPGEHTMTYAEEVPATCTKTGTVAYYYCNTCDRKFIDAEGTTEVKNFIAPALGHSFAEDGKCQREGCNETIVVLNNGENTVDVHTPTVTDDWQWSNDPEHFNLYLYKATADGDVTFSLNQNEQATCILYDSDYNVLVDKLNTSGTYFWFTYSGVKAGDILLLGVRGVFEYDFSSTITVVSVPSCAPGEHSMSYVEEKAVTCTTDGIAAHYHCSKCGFDYADEAGEKRIVETVIISLGHDYENNGNCQREGCGYKAVELKRGDNSVDLHNVTPYNIWMNTNIWDARHYKLMKYTVKADGDLTITSVGEANVFGILYDKNMQHVVDNWGYPNMMLTVNNVHAGDVFYIGARSSWGNIIDDYIINVDAPVPAMCDPGMHKLQEIEVIPATCLHNGKLAYYHCNVCDRDYTDAEGTQEADNLIVPALGHKYGSDGKCKHDGCDVTIPVLSYGENKYTNVQNPTVDNEWSNSDYYGPQNYSLFLYNVENYSDVYLGVQTSDGSNIVVYDSDMNLLFGTNKYTYGWYQDYTQFGAKPGDIIIIGVRGYHESIISDCNIMMYPSSTCVPGQHQLSFADEIPSTCLVNGIMAHYHCSECGFNYADENGETRLTDVVIPSLGHYYDLEGNCQREGCGYKAVELKIGDNAVNILNPTSAYNWRYTNQDSRHYTMFKFKVQADGDVTVKTVGGLDTFGALYNSDWYCMGTADGDPITDDYSDFKFVIENAKAGEVYYIGARGYYDTYIGDYTIHVDAKEDNLATGISSIQNADDEKAFNTMGQRVGKSTKGIVIINGRTVVRK